MHTINVTGIKQLEEMAFKYLIKTSGICQFCGGPVFIDTREFKLNTGEDCGGDGEQRHGYQRIICKHCGVVKECDDDFNDIDLINNEEYEISLSIPARELLRILLAALPESKHMDLFDGDDSINHCSFDPDLMEFVIFSKQAISDA